MTNTIVYFAIDRLLASDVALWAMVFSSLSSRAGLSFFCFSCFLGGGNLGSLSSLLDDSKDLLL